MKYGNLILEKREYVYLKRILNISGYAQDSIIQKSLQCLTEELKSAQVMNEEDMPPDVIRFNSMVTVKTGVQWQREFQLVIPTDDNLSQNKLSVLKPMGAALIGYAQDDVIEWEFPSGMQQLQIVAVKRDTSQSMINVPI